MRKENDMSFTESQLSQAQKLGKEGLPMSDKPIWIVGATWILILYLVGVAVNIREKHEQRRASNVIEKTINK